MGDEQRWVDWRCTCDGVSLLSERSSMPKAVASMDVIVPGGFMDLSNMASTQRWRKKYGSVDANQMSMQSNILNGNSVLEALWKHCEHLGPD
jgi:hypothetical protein